MTKEEINRLVAVLKKTGDMAREASMTDAHPATADYLIGQHARIHARLAKLDPSVKDLFEPLEPGVPFEVIAMACHQLAAYFHQSMKGKKSTSGKLYESVLDFGPFKIVVGQDFEDLRDIGQTIRDALKEERRHHINARAAWSKPPRPPQPPKPAKGKKGKKAKKAKKHHAPPQPPRPPHWPNPKEPWDWPFYDESGEEDL